jgi:hypothetical protein
MFQDLPHPHTANAAAAGRPEPLNEGADIHQRIVFKESQRMEQQEMDESEDNKTSFDEVKAEYANNTSLQPSVWDLKLFFGQWYQAMDGKSEVDWHSAVTIPWAQAKLLAHYLKVNVAVYEGINGKIKIPADMKPKLSEITGDSPDDVNESVQVMNRLTAEFLKDCE